MGALSEFPRNDADDVPRLYSVLFLYCFALHDLRTFPRVFRAVRGSARSWSGGLLTVGSMAPNLDNATEIALQRLTLDCAEVLACPVLLMMRISAGWLKQQSR